jgi:hypothetical protein
MLADRANQTIASEELSDDPTINPLSRSRQQIAFQ